VFEKHERRAIDDAAEARGLQLKEWSPATIEVSVRPPMKKTMRNSKGVICFPGRRPATRIMKTRKQ